MNCMAITLSRKEKFDEAVGIFCQDLKIRPDFADAWNDLGITLARQPKHREAIEAYREAIKCRPNFAAAYNNMGNALRHVGRFDEFDGLLPQGGGAEAVVSRRVQQLRHRALGDGAVRPGGGQLYQVPQAAADPRQRPHEPR